MRRGFGWVVGFVVVVALVVGGVVWWTSSRPAPGCVVTEPGTGRQITFTLEQTDNAATIAAVGIAEGMPDHAVTVAIATAMQESRLRNLPDGDRDSAGLFQQRPSQGWGTYAQVTEPVYAARAFYAALRELPDWQTASVTEAAQLVQRSAAPDAYAQWETQARAAASALTGEQVAALRCQDVTLAQPGEDVATLAARELGDARLSGPQATRRGWAVASWLVAHSGRLGLDQVSFDGRTWTADSGSWERTGPPDGTLALHRAQAG
ncbi:MAG: hypothetical protein OJJ54_11540 [Pseudonocardia sp.]|nr:hypothetical protein [Pseudonocardia sp.]